MKKILTRLPKNSMLFLSLSFAVMLIVLRIIHTGNIHLIFMLWNLFLAFIPFCLSTIITKNENKNWVWFCLPLWLLFFPNAPYIITDLFHLRERNDIAYWYDTLLLFSFALNGIMLAFISLKEIENFFIKKAGLSKARFIIISVLLMSAFGIYAGRYLRWNSWDMITNPSVLFLDINERIMNPMDHLKTYGVTLLYGSFLIISYYTVKWMPQAVLQENQD